MKNLYCGLFALVLLAACQHSSKNHGHESDHEVQIHAEESTSATIYSGNYELYAEIPQPGSTGESKILVHLTKLDNYSPVEAGKLTLSIGGQQVAVVDKPLSKGIFELPLNVSAGNMSLKFVLETSTETIVFESQPIELEHHQEAEEHGLEPTGSIRFTKEQSWNGNFRVEQIIPEPFGEVVNCSGEILVAPGDELIVSARTPGTVRLGPEPWMVGSVVKSGEQLMVVVGDQVDENLRTRYEKAKATLDAAKANAKRADKLIKDKIISQKQYEQIQAESKQAQAEFDAVSKNYSSGGQRIMSPANGVVAQMLVGEGSFVNSGDPLMVIRQNRSFVLKANLPRSKGELFEQISDADFIPGNSSEPVSVSGSGGHRIHLQEVGTNASAFLPVYFELPSSGSISVGQYAEVFLKTKGGEAALSVPVSALIERSGVFCVYIQTGGEQYAERDVQTGRRDAFRVEIVSGLNAGDRVVTKGAARVRLASMTNAVPAHTH